MNRKRFIKNSLLASGAVLLPGAIWALGGNTGLSAGNKNKFVSVPNLKRFKVSSSGARFFETELSILKEGSKSQLARKYFVSENVEGYGTPTLLENNKKESFVFIPELYTESKHNGFIVRVCADGLCEETKIFTHENQGFYAFWGKEYLGNPTLYHYNLETLHLMRAHRENEQWINHRVMPMYPDEMVLLYKQQLQQVEQGQLSSQFGYDFEIHKDGFYQFLKLKYGWEQCLITQEKEGFEKANPAIIHSDLNEFPKSGLNNTGKFYDYSYPIVAIYCKGDDLSRAIIKPTIIYGEVKGSKIEIPNMPAYKTQDQLGECRAFALGVVLQKYTCEKWKKEIPDCKNPPADLAISYFGLLAYTNQNVEQSETFQPSQEKARSMYDIINEISRNGGQLLLESCKPFENFAGSFTRNAEGLTKCNEFFVYLKRIFEANRSKNNITANNYTKELQKINSFVNLNITAKTLNKAFKNKNFDGFLYTLFFDDCEYESFPSGFKVRAYPDDSINPSHNELKERVKQGLVLGKPVLYAGLCISQNDGEECDESHALVISGYKRASYGSVIKDVFKVHNSWGSEWQKQFNDGWVDADILCRNATKFKTASGYKISSGIIIWLD